MLEKDVSAYITCIMDYCSSIHVYFAIETEQEKKRMVKEVDDHATLIYN